MSVELPKVTVRECGCVLKESSGHTHVKFCATCRAEFFAAADRGRTEPNNFDLVGG